MPTREDPIPTGHGREASAPRRRALEACVAGLSPRLRQTLAHLLEGDAEKQIAAQLGSSQATTHQYVTTLYRHFGVQSRAQLIADLLRQLAPGLWGEVLDGLAPDAALRTR